jgi:hypothetical protein
VHEFVVDQVLGIDVLISLSNIMLLDDLLDPMINGRTAVRMGGRLLREMMGFAAQRVMELEV